MAKDFLVHYEEYKDKIYSYFYFRLNFNQSIAEDMTQEVFLKALRNFDSFDASKSFQAWIYTIAKNHLKNYYRVQGREVDLLSCEKQISTDTISKLDAKIEWEEVLEKIKTLPDNYSEVLLLRFVDGLDNKEIAEVLEKEEGAIRTRISRALKAIKEISKNNEVY